jgi:hypothetical protein
MAVTITSAAEKASVMSSAAANSLIATGTMGAAGCGIMQQKLG